MIQKTLTRLALQFIVALFLTTAATAQTGSRVLIVDAHPDDETAYAATVYKLTHDFNGLVDLVVVTNGEAGFKYSTLAEKYYNLKLTDETVGRKYLPGIRHKELEAAGKIIGLHHIFFLDQRDNRYTLDPHEVLDSNWDVPKVKAKLKEILTEGHYDFVFTLVPTDSTHGHHKAATILALTAVNDLPASTPHPIVLAGTVRKKDAPQVAFHALSEFPITQIADSLPQYQFDRTQSFGFRHNLNYKVIVNWEIAEHKSQGTMQLGMNQGDLEEFYYYSINAPEGRAKAKALFDKLATKTYPELTYPGIK